VTRDDELTNRWIDIRYTKWPSQPHDAYRMRILGEDDYGRFAFHRGVMVGRSAQLTPPA
jgi:hypothetical protein